MAGRRAGRRLVRLHGNRKLLVSPSLEQKRRGRPRLFSFLHIVKPSEARADTDSVSLTLHPPARMAVLFGALVLTGLAAVVFMLGRGALGGESAPRRPPRRLRRRSRTMHSATTEAEAAAPGAEAREAGAIASGFPARIDHALRYSGVVVVSVSIPGAAGRPCRAERSSLCRKSLASRVRCDQRAQRTGGRRTGREDGGTAGSGRRDRQAPRNGRSDVLRGGCGDDRAGGRSGTPMSEAALQTARRTRALRPARAYRRQVGRTPPRGRRGRSLCRRGRSLAERDDREPRARRPVLLPEPGRGDALRHARGRGVHRARLRSRGLLSGPQSVAATPAAAERPRVFARPEVSR